MTDTTLNDVETINGTRYHHHPNGGGLVAETANVENTVHVAPMAIVSGNANLTGNVRVTGFAQVGGDVQACDDVTFSGRSITEHGNYRGHTLIHSR